MGETLHLLFHSREDGTFELRVKENWSGRTVCGTFVPPYTNKQLNTLHKKLNDAVDEDFLRGIGERLFRALCGSAVPGASRRDLAEQSTQAVLRTVIQRTLHRRGTVALTFSFGPGCEEFVRYPWELLHNGEHFLIRSGIFTLTRDLVHPEQPVGCELPVHPPMRLLYISASPRDCEPIETERSFEALQRAFADAIENNQVILDKIDQITFDTLVQYFSDCGGVGMFDDNETTNPCYAIHFDGHGAFGRLCPGDDCDRLNAPEARKCVECGAALNKVKAQTYLCFCDEKGYNRYIDTQSLRELLISSDVRLAVFSACETATLGNVSSNGHHRHITFDATLATALVMSQIPAVVAMPFSLQDDLSPTFVLHFYEALSQGRTLEEALARARHAMLPKSRHQGWFVPVLYRHVSEDQERPVPLLAVRDEPEEHDHPLAHLKITETFVGRDAELRDLSDLLAAAARGEARESSADGQYRLRPGTHHIALTGPAGIGKSALALEAVQRNRDMFSGGVIGISLQNGKNFQDALVEIAHALHIAFKTTHHDHPNYREEQVLNVLRSRASRELPCLLLLESFEEVKEHLQLEAWHHFLRSLPPEVVVLATSRSNPAAITATEGAPYRWYEFPVGKMQQSELLHLFRELASANGLDQRIHLNTPEQQAILREICDLLDGYPLGAELIFGTARSIDGKLYTPEAATRSLEEVRDELRDTRLDGIWAVLEVAYRRLSPLARLLLSYLAAFRLPFSHEQIIMLVDPEASRDNAPPERPGEITDSPVDQVRDEAHIGDTVPEELARRWREARDELVQSSFLDFDGRVYTIHPQVRNFALSYLPQDKRRRVHRVVAHYYLNHPQPSPAEWLVAYEHLVSAGEAQDLQEAIRVAVRASWAMRGRGHARPLLGILHRAEELALRLGDKTGEGRLQCCIGAILRSLGQYAEAVACLSRSLALHREQNERKEIGWALYELAMLAREEGHFQQAGQYAQEALQLFREIDDSSGEAWMQMVIGEVSRGCGEYYDALGHLELALTSFRKYYNDEGYAWALRDRGTVYEALGRYNKALADYEEARRIFNGLGMRDGQGWVFADQSVVYMDLGIYDRAEQLCNEAIAIFREQGGRRGEGWSLRALGDTERHKHAYGNARSYYEDAQNIFTRLGDRFDQARVLNSLGTISIDEGEHLTAKEFYEQALAIAQEQGARQLEGRALRGLGDVYRALRLYAEAERSYHDAQAIAEKLDTPAERCAVLRRLGYLRHAQERNEQALDFWVQALAIDQRLGHAERAYLQQQVETLVSEQHLEAVYAELAQQHGLGLES